VERQSRAKCQEVENVNNFRQGGASMAKRDTMAAGTVIAIKTLIKAALGSDGKK
jgi:hypothetical protein